MALQLHGRELTLSGTVGESILEDGFTHAEVVKALAGLRGDITVRLNSGGGYATEGTAIYSALAAHGARVHVVVDGIAASAASLIAMAGSTITMADGAVMMIHDPQNITFGNSADHSKTIEQLEAISAEYANVYAKRSGKTPVQARNLMKAETWFTGDEAVAAGFATASGGARSRAVAAYDYTLYVRAPHALKAQAVARGWSREAPSRDTGVQARVDDAKAAAKASWAKIIARKSGKPAPVTDSPVADLWRRAAHRAGLKMKGDG